MKKNQLQTILADGKMGKVQMGTYTDPDTGKERIVAVKTVKDQKSFLLEEVRSPIGPLP